MSHFTTVKTRMSDVDCLKAALTYMQLNYEEGECSVKTYEGETERVDLAIRTGSEYDIGFRKTESEYEMVADWWAIERSTDLKEEITVNNIRQRYAYEKIMKEQQELSRQGFKVAREEVTEENVQVITLRRY